MGKRDADLPGDSTFRPAGPEVEIIINSPAGPLSAIALTISPIEQANLHHNQLRYAELTKLRAAQPNRYEQTSYRH